MGGDGTIIIGDIYTPAPFIPPFPRKLGQRFGRTFEVRCSESGLPLPDREFIAMVDGVTVSGATDANGVALVLMPNVNSRIAIHVKFKSPARTLSEFMEGQ